MWTTAICWNSSARKRHVIRAYYYSAVLETEEYSPLKPLTDWLAYNGYTLVTKPAKEFTDSTGRRRVKGNMDIELAIDMLELADKIDHAVLFSGDSDFRRLVEAVQRRGVRVSVVSSIRTTPPMVADELRRQADQFLELAEIAPEFTRRQMEPRPDAACRCARPPPSRSPTAPSRSDRARCSAQDAHDPRRAAAIAAPARDCALCPRLAAYRAANRAANPDWFNAPVPSFGPVEARLLVVGMAPGVRGANRTGRPFTGDHAGLLLYQTLLRFGLAEGTYRAEPDDGLALRDTRIVNAVRCVPPANLPEPAEVADLQPVPGRRTAGHAEPARGAGARRAGPCGGAEGLRHSAEPHPLPPRRRSTTCRTGCCWPTATMSAATIRPPAADRGDVQAVMLSVLGRLRGD